MWRALEDFCIEGPGCFILLGLFAVMFLIAIVGSCNAEKAAREEFMRQCMEERKEYECVALWRQGEKDSQVVPIPIVIPVR